MLEQSGPLKRVLADLNGERWRAEHYGVGIASFGDGFGEALFDPECYVVVMGDVGAAAGRVIVAMAVERSHRFVVIRNTANGYPLNASRCLSQSTSTRTLHQRGLCL